MNPAQQLATAISLAAHHHCNQSDKSGKPYILHTLKVMHYLKTEDYELMAIAVLHDIIEDTDCLYRDLHAAGLSERVVFGVQAMTKLPGQTPDEYMAQLKDNVDACHVKLADLRHNSDIRRLKGLTEKDFKRVANLDVLGYYFIEDGGDGSASVRFYKKRDDAEKDEAALMDLYGQGSLSEGVRELNFDDFMSCRQHDDLEDQ